MDIKEILIDIIKSQPALFYIILVILTIYLVAYFSYLTSTPEAIEERRWELKEILNLAPLFALLALVFLVIDRKAWVRKDVFLGGLFVIYLVGVWVFSKHLANHYNSVGRTRFSIPFLSIGLVLVGLPILQTILETLPRIPDIPRLFSIGAILCGIFGALNLFLLDQLLKNILMMIPWKTRGVLITTLGLILVLVTNFWNPDIMMYSLMISSRFVAYCILLGGIIDLTKYPIYEGFRRIYMWIKIHVKTISRVIGTGTGIYLLFLTFFPNLLVTRVSGFLVAIIDELVGPDLKYWTVFSLGIFLIIGSNFSFFSRIGLQIGGYIRLGAFYLKRELLSFYSWFKVNVFIIMKVFGSFFGLALIGYALFATYEDVLVNGLLGVAGGILLSVSNYEHVLRFASWSKNELLAFYQWFSLNFVLIMRRSGTFVGLALITYDYFLYKEALDNWLLVTGGILLTVSNPEYVLRFASWSKKNILLAAFYLKNGLLSFYTWFKVNISTILRVLGSLGGVILIILGWILDEMAFVYRLLGVGSGVILLSGSNYDHVLWFASWSKNELLAFYQWFSLNFVLIMRSLGVFTGLAFITYDWFLYEDKTFDNVLLIFGVILLLISNYNYVLRFASWSKNELLAFYQWFSRNFVLILRDLGSFSGLALITYDLFLNKEELISAWFIFGVILLSGSNYDHVLRFASWTKNELLALYQWFSRNFVLIMRRLGTLIGLALIGYDYFGKSDVIFHGLLGIAGVILVSISNYNYVLRFASWSKNKLLAFYQWFSRNFILIIRVFGSGLGLVLLLPERFSLPIKVLGIPKADIDEIQNIFLILGIFLLVGCNYRFIGLLLQTVWIRITKSLTRAARWFIRNRIMIFRVCGSFIGWLFVFIYFDSRFIRPKNLEDCLCYWFSLFGASTTFPKSLPDRILGLNITVFLLLGTFFLILSNLNFVYRLILRISYGLRLFARFMAALITRAFFWFVRNKWSILRGVGTFFGIFLGFVGSVEHLTGTELMPIVSKAIIEHDLDLLRVYLTVGFVLVFFSNFKEFKRGFLKILELLYRLSLITWLNIKSFAFWFASWIKKKLISVYHWFSRNRSLILRVLGSGLGLVLLLISRFPSTINALGIPATFMNGRLKSQYLFIFAGFLLLVACNHRFIWLLLRKVWTAIMNLLTRVARWFIRNLVIIIRVCGSFVGLIFIIFERLSSIFGGYEELRVPLGISFIILSNLNIVHWLILRISYGLRLFARFIAVLVARAFAWLVRNKWSILRGVGTFFGIFLGFVGSVEHLTDTELMPKISSIIKKLDLLPALIYLTCGAVLLILSNFEVFKRIFLKIWELSYRLGLFVWMNIKSFAFWVTKNIRAIGRVLITAIGILLIGIGGGDYFFNGSLKIVESDVGLAFAAVGTLFCIVANPQEFRTLIRAIKNSLLSIWRWIHTEKVLIARTLIILMGFYLVSRWVFPGKPLLQSLVTSENEIVKILDYCLPFASFIIAFIDYAINYLIIAFKTIKESLKFIFAWVIKHFTEIRKVTVTFLVGLFWLYFLVFQTLPRNWQAVIFLLGLTVLIINFAREIERVIKSFVQAFQDALRWMITGFKKLIAFFKEWTVVMGMVLLALVFIGFGSYVIISDALRLILDIDLGSAVLPLSLGLGSIALGVILFWLVNKRRRISPEKGVKG